MLSLTDANGNTTTFGYDGNNRVTSETRPMGQATTYTYDAIGTLSEKTDAKGQKTKYTYDTVGRLIETNYYSSNDYYTPTKTVYFTYDSTGNLTSYNDAVSSAVYVYDSLSRKVSETVSVPSSVIGNPSLTWSYSYDYYANGKKKSFTDPAGTTYQYAYDWTNNLATISVPGQGIISYNYEHNLPVRITYPGGTQRELAYDPLTRLSAITVKDPGQNVIMQYGYTYDPMNNILTKQTEHGNYAYSYDRQYQLTSATSPTTTEAFSYDPVGNRSNWAHNNNNELLHADGVTYTYDANGNTIAVTSGTNTTTYEYDVENRLTRVKDGSNAVTATYYYDPFGRRLSKRVNGTTTNFLYSDEGLIAETDGTGTMTKTYGYIPDSTWTTNPLFMTEGGNYYWYQNDHLGTPHTIVANNGTVVWEGRYDSFGKATLNPASTITNNIRFPGQYLDEETKLCQNWHRSYDQHRGRYISEDPIGFRGKDINLNRYARNNPISMSDYSGLWSPGYGNYCGPGRNGNNFTQKATNCVDSACRTHDECLDNARKKNKNSAWWWLSNQEVRKCHLGIINDIASCKDPCDPEQIAAGLMISAIFTNLLVW